MNKSKFLIVALASCWSMMSAHAAQPAADPDSDSGFVKTGENSMEATNTVQVEAKVIDVNKKTREIKLRSPDGDEVSVVAGDEVRNFDKIKKGDQLRVNYFESIALELRKGGGAPVVASETTDVNRAKPGEKPSGAVLNRVAARGTITKLDKKTQSVTVKGPNRTVVLHVAKKDVFDKIKKGDQIDVTYTQAMAVSIESVKK